MRVRRYAKPGAFPARLLAGGDCASYTYGCLAAALCERVGVAGRDTRLCAIGLDLPPTLGVHFAHPFQPCLD
jgi:hypothetical protein